MNLGILGNLSVFTTSATPANFAAIDKEIREGLKNEQPRLDRARTVRDFYEGNFQPYQEDYPHRLGVHNEDLVRRSIPFVRSIINAKIRRHYMSNPVRKIKDNPDATGYLEMLYNKGRINPKLKAALKFAALGGVSAIQVELNQPGMSLDGQVNQEQSQATLSLARPAVNFRLWAPDEFCVWCSPDEPLTPWAVATIDRYDNQTRCRLWTPETFAVYRTKKWDGSTNTRGTRTFEPVSVEDNFLGLVPFAFLWWEAPTKEFWGWAPGPELMRINDHANARLTKIADDTLWTRPILFGRNIADTFKIPDRYVAGDVVKLPGLHDIIGDGIEGPSIEATVADLSYLAADREELDTFLDLEGEMHGVPAEAWRNKSNAATSGVAIISEQLPIIEECEARQELLEETERDLALVTLMTVNAWLGNVPAITQAINDFELSIDWPPLTKNRPGPDFDQHLQFEMVNEISGPVQVYMQMTGATEEEALEHFEQKARQAAYLAQIAPQVDPLTGQPIQPETMPEEPTETEAGTEGQTEEEPEEMTEEGGENE
jgi:hypothetical protein